ncbi:TIGR03560 family F420-dependent LLM class oxidoreductase [Actinophytocola sp.]|uniref:TIGR03560 family F420-dependent LLM class oxidoreductase n=1 Tax=Actinophytocola sp. TaxID=1872138 RepID=UPI002D37D77A|nr:TIGR03560 family F420-dependent LLM class oxidoreductase [Actinophytocola sp.]HYQ68200.1 TIGR03560 family F420-dependent LLM class oxidoreductase [Actinophytocola sp.]
MRLRVLMEPRHGGTYEDFLAMATVVEDAGFEGFFRSDHLMGVDPTNTAYQPTDSWTMLAGLARDTRRVRLGALVTAGTFRQPGVLATTVAMVDQMSGGRVDFGIGAGWFAEEHTAFGLEFPAVAARFERLEEQLKIITGLWETPRGTPFTFTGKHYRLRNNGILPRTAQSPRPPIIVGGAGARKTPTIAARHADEFNLSFPQGLKARNENFNRICAELGRDPATVRRSVVLPVACGETPAEANRRAETIAAPPLRAEAVVGTPRAVADRVAALQADGVDTVYFFHLFDIKDLDHIRLIGAEVVPLLSALP